MSSFSRRDFHVQKPYNSMVSCSQLSTVTTRLLSIIQAATTASFFLLEHVHWEDKLQKKKWQTCGDRDQNQQKIFKEVLLHAMGRPNNKEHLNTETFI